MGTNRRYAESIDRRTNERILERIAERDVPLQTLSAIELHLDRYALTIDPLPKPVKAGVRFGSTHVIVDAEACRWTTRAVGIRFRVGEKEHRCWVWLQALETDGD